MDTPSPKPAAGGTGANARRAGGAQAEQGGVNLGEGQQAKKGGCC